MKIKFKKQLFRCQYYYIPDCEVTKFIFSLVNNHRFRRAFTQIHFDKFKELGFDIIVEDLKEKKVIKN